MESDAREGRDMVQICNLYFSLSGLHDSPNSLLNETCMEIKDPQGINDEHIYCRA